MRGRTGAQQGVSACDIRRTFGGLIAAALCLLSSGVVANSGLTSFTVDPGGPTTGTTQQPTGPSTRYTVSGPEICGLVTATFDVIFLDGFDTQPSGLGPTLGTVTAPTFGVTPTISITNPSPPITLIGGLTQVSGTVSGPVDTGVVVNGVRAYVNNGQFLTPLMSVDPSTTTLVATATTVDGLSATATNTVSSVPGVPATTFTTGTPIGFAALPVQFRLATNVAQTVQSVSVTFGDGNNYNGSSLGYLPVHTYATPGLYIANATITFTSGSPQNASAMVMALALSEQRNNLCSVYAYLRAQMVANNVSNATHALMGDLSVRLTPFFQALSTNSEIASVAAQLGSLAAGSIGLNAADIMAVRDVGNQVLGYPVHFARDANGVWRIDGM